MSKRRGAKESGHTDVPSDRVLFAKNFRKARKEAGLTQQQIHELTGFAQAWISEVETAKSTINLDNMGVLAKAVRVPLWKLLLPESENLDSAALE